MQISFSRLWDGYDTDKLARQARNKIAKELRRAGYIVHCFTLANQLKQYESFGVPDGRSCTVYALQYYGVNNCRECGNFFDDNPSKNICKTCEDWIVTE